MNGIQWQKPKTVKIKEQIPFHLKVELIIKYNKKKKGKFRN